MRIDVYHRFHGTVNIMWVPVCVVQTWLRVYCSKVIKSILYIFNNEQTLRPQHHPPGKKTAADAHHMVGTPQAQTLFYRRVPENSHCS